MENLKNFLKKRMATLNIVLISKKIGTLKKLPTKFVLHFNYAKGIGGGKSFFHNLVLFYRVFSKLQEAFY